MKTTKQTFINKWSCWWALGRQGKQLTEAFERELDKLINPKGEEIARKELLDRKFTYRYWLGDEDEVFQEYFFELEMCDFDEIVVSVEYKSVELVAGTKHYPIPNCHTLAQLDALIEMFKTSKDE